MAATLFVTPLWMLALKYPEYVPRIFDFVLVTEEQNIPIIWQLLILEFIIDGLKLSSLNTPGMLSSTFSIIAGIIVSDFAVKSGWFASETMLYMAFVTVANYSQSSYELGYALKFMRVILLILTALLDVPGFLLGSFLVVLAIVFNKTIAGKSYIYPLIPFSWSECKKRFFRGRLPHTTKNS